MFSPYESEENDDENNFGPSFTDPFNPEEDLNQDDDYDQEQNPVNSTAISSEHLDHSTTSIYSKLQHNIKNLCSNLVPSSSEAHKHLQNSQLILNSILKDLSNFSESEQKLLLASSVFKSKEFIPSLQVSTRSLQEFYETRHEYLKKVKSSISTVALQQLIQNQKVIENCLRLLLQVCGNGNGNAISKSKSTEEKQ